MKKCSNFREFFWSPRSREKMNNIKRCLCYRHCFTVGRGNYKHLTARQNKIRIPAFYYGFTVFCIYKIKHWFRQKLRRSYVFFFARMIIPAWLTSFQQIKKQILHILPRHNISYKIAKCYCFFKILQFGVIWYTKPLKRWCKTACFGNSFCFRLHRQNVSRFLFKQ